MPERTLAVGGKCFQYCSFRLLRLHGAASTPYSGTILGMADGVGVNPEFLFGNGTSSVYFLFVLS